MWLRQVNLIGTSGYRDIRIDGHRIAAVAPFDPDPGPESEPGIQLNGALVFPGLINSHDHLDFNLFPRLGNGIYRNYTAWGNDIHLRNKQTIEEVLKVPLALRTAWGIYKNLLNGVTTVVNHGERLTVPSNTITVFQDARSLHSPAFERNWKWKLNMPFAGRISFVMHLGEGTDAAAKQEIDRVAKWNLIRRKIIAVHGVAMTERQARAFQALVWCPDSNFFLLNSTASVDRLRSAIDILFGTDSTLTSDWNLWEQLRLARKQGLLSDRQLIDTLTTNAARVWSSGRSGQIMEGEEADLVIAKPKPGLRGLDRFFDLNPADLLLVIHRGNIRLFDETILDRVGENDVRIADFSRVELSGSVKYIWGQLPQLMEEIGTYYPAASFPVTACSDKISVVS
ncbi:MAG TPA: amidohydrolase family protein [Puia sp.]|nr:amidohydrolase family protein [Puia sp.]